MSDIIVRNCIVMSLGGSTGVDRLSPSSLPGSQDLIQDTTTSQDSYNRAAGDR